MFIESLKYGLHLATPDNLCVQQRLMLHIIYLHIFNPTPPPSALFISLLLRTVCSLFSHIICNNLHLHIPTAVMATKGKQEIQGGSGEGRAGHARMGKKPAEANRVNLWLFWLLTAKGVCLI